MKILFINRSDLGGGAAKVGWRLGWGLNKYYKTENHYLVEVKRTNKKNVIEVRSNSMEKLAGLFLNKLFSTLGLQYLYLPISSRNILKKVKQINPDVISMHNIHGGYFQTDLLSKLSKYAPVVWTFHDMWPVTRNAAHTFGDDSWREMKPIANERSIYPQIGINTGGYLLRRKKKIYANSRFLVVSPSDWMLDIAEKSPLLEGKKIVKIYHGVDHGVFKSSNKRKARKKLRINTQKKIIMFGSDILNNNPWKGGETLSEILNKINRVTDDEIVILIVGKGNVDFLKKYKNLTVKHMGYISSERKLADCYNAADCFINPTRADSLSLMLVEAISCGLPCVAYAIGGTKEVIVNGVNGYLVEPFNKDEFTERVLKILKNEKLSSKMSASGEEIARQKYSLKIMAKKYYKLFRYAHNYVK